MAVLSEMYSDLNIRNIKLITCDIGFADAATIEMNGLYGIFLDLSCFATIKTYRQTLAHEIGHCATGCTHKVSSPLDLVQKHEYKANRWAIEKYIPFEELNNAISSGYTETWQLAEYFDFPDSFMKSAIEYYTVIKERKFE